METSNAAVPGRHYSRVMVVGLFVAVAKLDLPKKEIQRP